MAYKNDSEEFSNRKYVNPIKKRLTQEQLLELDIEIKKYTVEKYVDFPSHGKINWFDMWKWLGDKGAVTKDKYHAIKVNNFKNATYDKQGHLKDYADCEPILYEQLMEDLDQYYSWKGRNQFIEKKKIEGLEQVASQMKVEKNDELAEQLKDW